MAFNFDDLDPAAKRAAFAHMGGGKGKRLGSGARHKKLSAKKKAAVEHHGKASVSGKLGHGSMKGELPADHEKGSMGGKLPIAKGRPAVRKPAAAKPEAADTPESRFEKTIGEHIGKLTAGRNTTWAGLVDLRKHLDSSGFSRAQQDAHMKRMGREGKLHIVPEDNRKALTQADHEAALRLAGEDNHFVGLAGAKEFEPKATPKVQPLPSTDPKKLAASRTPEDHADLAQKFLQMHGDAGVQHRIAMLEKRKRLAPGERAQLAALKSLSGGSSAKTAGPGGISEDERAKLQAFVAKRQAQTAASPDDRFTAGAKEDAAKKDAITLKQYGGHEGVANRIARLERRKNLAPGERAQLAMLRSLLKK